MEENKNHKKVIESAKKIIADKTDVIAYSNGKISKKQLNDRGVKLTMPL